MKGDIELKVIERPASLDLGGGKSREVYTKIIATLDVMKATKCIELDPEEIKGKNPNTKCVNLRAGLNRAIKILKKDYHPVVSYSSDLDVIYVWSRIIIK